MGSTPRRLAVAVVALCLAASWAFAGPAEARVFLSVDEALDLAFPGCTVERSTVYLTDAEVARVETLAGEEPAGAIVHPYAASCPRGSSGAAGTAYFDTHRVRTLAETLMVVVAADGTVRRLEILTFDEPQDYIPREIWYDQFDGQELDGDLSLKRDIRPVTGATLTARATTEAVRRVLAIHQVLAERGEDAGR